MGTISEQMPVRQDPAASDPALRTQQRDQPAPSAKAKTFYPPDVIAAYSVISLPVGFILYSLNVLRRGQRAPGWILLTLSVVYGVEAVITGRSIGIGLLGCITAIAFIHTEDAPYRRALESGGARARWWPPLLWILGATLVSALF